MHLALGPFLALGGMVALLAGDDVPHWYTDAELTPASACKRSATCRPCRSPGAGDARDAG